MPKKSNPTGKAKVRKALAKLKPKQAEYVKQRAKGKDKRNAARAAGYSESVARIADEKIERTPKVREAFQALMQEMIDPKRIVQRISEGLDAKETKFATFEGEITDSRDCIDFTERRQYAELAAKLGGFYNEKLEIDGANDIHVTVEYVGAP